MSSQYDVVIAGGGLAGLTLARQLHLEAPQLRVLVCEKRQHPVPEAAFKVGESSVEIGAHYFQKVIGLEPLLCRDHLPKLGLRYFFPARREPRSLAPRRAGRRRLPARAVLPARSRTARELAAADGARIRHRGRSTAARVRQIELGDSRPYRDGGDAGGVADGADALAGRLQRPRRPAEAAARDEPPLDPSRERLLVPGRATACASTTGRTTRRGRPAYRRPALAEHQPSDGHRLLGVADSARLRQHQLRHRRRRGAASVSSPQSLRSRARLAAGVRAAMRRRGRALRAARSKTFAPCSTSRTAARGCSRQTAGR